MLPRIASPKFGLGFVVFLALSLEPNAFTLPAHSPFVVRPSRIGISTTATNDIIWPDHSGVEPPSREPDEFLASLDPAPSRSKTSSRLSWLFLALSTILPIFNTKTASATSSLEGNPVIFSTVSATLLRSSRRVKGGVPLQQLLAYGLLSWQLLLNVGHFVRWTSVLGTSFATWYMASLTSFPLYTKALTTGVIGLLGDTTAQLLEERIRSRKEGDVFQFRRRYDQRRVIAKLIDGIFVTGPLLHLAYNLLEHMIPVSGGAMGATIAALLQVLIDDFVLDACFVGIMFFTTGFGEGYSVRDIFKQFRTDYKGAVRTSWATSVLLMPLEFVLFRFFPLSVRVLGMNLIDIIWEGMVSFLVHKRRKSGSLEEQVQEMQDLLEMDHHHPAPVPAQ